MARPSARITCRRPDRAPGDQQRQCARDGRPRVAIVNQAYANGFPDQQAIGRTIRVTTWRRQSDPEVEAELRDVEIVGVIESAGERQYSADGSPVGKIYLPSPLGPDPALTLYVRS